jgi:hypothetical protein
MRRQSEAVEQHLRQMGIVCFAILMGTVLVAGYSPSQEFPSYLVLGANLLALVVILKAQFLHRFFPGPGPQAPEEAVLAWPKEAP